MKALTAVGLILAFAAVGETIASAANVQAGAVVTAELIGGAFWSTVQNTTSIFWISFNELIPRDLFSFFFLIIIMKSNQIWFQSQAVVSSYYRLLSPTVLIMDVFVVVTIIWYVAIIGGGDWSKYIQHWSIDIQHGYALIAMFQS